MRPRVLLAGLVFLFALAGAGNDDAKFNEQERDAYYKWFGLSRGSFDKDELASAYRRLAKQYHPDKSPGNQEVFYKIARAFDTLGDDAKRAAYDRGGPGAVDGSAGGSSGGADFAHDIFARMFNFGGPFGFASNSGKPRGPDARMDMEVGLEDVFLGKTATVSFTRQTVCMHCQGSGADDAKDAVRTCATCNGAGIEVVVRQIMPGFVQRMQGVCSACGGAGRTIVTSCRKCKGARTASSEESLSLRIPPGAPEGHATVFEGMSEEQPGADTGDLLVVLRTRPHASFRRDGANLYTTVHISLAQAIAGFELTLSDLGGNQIKLARRDRVTQPNFVEALPGMGLPVYGRENERGTLFVEYRVVLPSKPSADLLKLARAKSSVSDVHDEL